LIKEFFLLISKKNGKALALSTPIPTPTGWKTMGELEVGDQVFGFDGKPCNVINTSEVFTDHDCYELTFSNGQKVVADAGHKWVTQARWESEESVKTTRHVIRTFRQSHRMRMSPIHDLERVGAHVGFMGWKKVPPVPVKCISVDSPDHQFLFGETMLPTHNSSIAGGIMLTALVLNWRESGEFLILAPTVEVAQNAYNPIRDMIRRDEELQEIFQVQDHYRTVTHRITGATLKVVAADSATVSGKKAIGILVDELWLFGKNAHADNMLMEATGGLASRPEGFIIYLTTQSDKPPAGVFRAKLQYARNVRDGVINDPAFLPVLYEHPAAVLEAKGHLLPENFYMTNPNYGASVDEMFMERGLAQAKQEGQEKLLTFLAKHLNVEIGLALRSDRWAGADFWLSSNDKSITFNRLLEICEVICVGIDGGGLDDLLGFAVAGRLKDGKGWVSWSHAWAHTSVLERRKAESPALLDFRDQGDLTIVERMGQDVEDIASYVAQIQHADLLFQVGLDPAGIGSVLDALLEAEVPEEKIIGVSQGWKLGGAIKTTERKLAEGLLTHAEQQLMNWCVGNARVEPRANSILITKQASGSAKIDPLMALFNAITLLSLNPPAQTKKFQMMILG
jgi:phage terminase large subunit-like protein